MIKKQKLTSLVALCLTLLFSACATNFSLPKSTKTGAISQENYARMKGPASLNGLNMGWKYSIPTYISFSVYRGTKPWLGDPKTVIASQTSAHASIQVFADNASPAWGEVATDFANEFTQALSAQMDRTWKTGKNRFYDIDLLMFPQMTKINRKYRQVFWGKTFHVRFYFPLYDAKTRYDTGEMRSIGGTVAHESYHMRVSHLGGANAKPFRKDLSKTQWHILNETGARFFGNCIELQTKGKIDFRRTVVHHKLEKATGKVRVGSLSDTMLREALTPGAKIHRDDLVAYGSMLFATYWAQNHGTGTIIKKGDETADKMQDLCDNHMADPTDLWPIFWEMANDGIDAPDFSGPFDDPAPAS